MTTYSLNALNEVIAMTAVDLREPHEEEQAFLQRVIYAADALPSDHWVLLSKEAREWINDCVNVMKDNLKAKPNALKPLPGFDYSQEMPSYTQGTMADKTAKRWSGERPKKQVTPVTELPGVMRQIERNQELADAVQERVRELLCENPSLTYEQTVRHLQQEGMSFSGTLVERQYDNVMDTIHLLYDWGKLKSDVFAA